MSDNIFVELEAMLILSLAITSSSQGSFSNNGSDEEENDLEQSSTSFRSTRRATSKNLRMTTREDSDSDFDL